MTDGLLHDTSAALQQEWGLQLPAIISEDVIVRLLADKIMAVIALGPEAFFQLMYRLDISEKKLTAILHEPEVAMKAARLVYDRQLQKIESRKENRMTRQDDDTELKW